MADEYNQNQQYQQPAQPQYQAQPYIPGRKPDPVTTGNWVLTLLIAAIPVLNIIMLLVWSFGSSTEKSKSNWAKAQLIWTLIVVAISVIASLVFGVNIYDAVA